MAPRVAMPRFEDTAWAARRRRAAGLGASDGAAMRPAVRKQLSPAMREILTSCASAGGAVLCAELVAQRVRRGEAQAVVRASLSRTLRRLWTARLWSRRRARGKLKEA